MSDLGKLVESTQKATLQANFRRQKRRLRDAEKDLKNWQRRLGAHIPYKMNKEQTEAFSDLRKYICYAADAADFLMRTLK